MGLATVAPVDQYPMYGRVRLRETLVCGDLLVSEGEEGRIVQAFAAFHPGAPLGIHTVGVEWDHYPGDVRRLSVDDLEPISQPNQG